MLVRVHDGTKINDGVAEALLIYTELFAFL